MNLPAIIVILILFSILMISFSIEKIDHFPIGLIIGAIAVILMLFLGVTQGEIVGFINFSTLVFIFAMQIIIYFATNDGVLDYITIRLIHLTKGNNRLFFYMICIFTGTLVAFIEDLTLSLILVPLIFRTCSVLKIRAGTYMMGMTITINIGAILTPISSLKNLVIGSEFKWGFGEYLANMGILFLITLFSTIFLIDRFIIKKEESPSEENKQLLLSILNPNIAIQNKKYFITTIGIIIATFSLMIIGFSPALVAIISAGILILIHSKNYSFSDINKNIEWKLIIV
ncbi:MAG: SLC13 family permease, partial [Promethearchaeota archaeon]